MKNKIGRLVLASGILVFSSSTFADVPDQIIDLGAQRANNAASSQRKIDDIAESTDKIIRRTQQEAKVVEDLRAYNDKMRRTLAAQEKAMRDLERSIEEASLIERQIVPLMLRMIEGLDRFVAADVPFEKDKRLARIERIRGYLTNANISAAERFRQVLQAYSIEAGYGKTLNVYTDSVVVDGQSYSVNVLQVGRTGLYYQTLDGSLSGHWSRDSQDWEALPSEFNGGITHAIQVVQGKKAAETLLELPISAPEA